MSKSTRTGDFSSDWADAGNWSPVGVPGVGSDVTIAIGQAITSASIGTVNSITDSASLSFESAGTNSVTTTLYWLGAQSSARRVTQHPLVTVIDRQLPPPRCGRQSLADDP
jgi:hypothetical protein